MVTPFSSDGSLDESALRRVANYLVEDMRNEGLVVCGTTGESPTLSREEKRRVLEVVLEEVGDRAAVVAGAGTYNTAESVELIREAESLGAHGVMVVNPYYNKPGQAGLDAHFRACAAATSLPVMLYNIAPRSAINLETPTLLRLAEVENIVAVKEASGSITQVSDVCGAAPAGFRVYSGDETITLPVLSVGGYGVVSVIGHVFGDRLREMIEVFPSDPGAASRIHHQSISVVRALFSSPNPVPVKYALSKKGLMGPTVRLPLVEMTDSEKGIVDAGLEESY